MMTGTSLHNPLSFHRDLRQLEEKRLNCLLILYKGCKMNLIHQEHHKTSKLTQTFVKYNPYFFLRLFFIVPKAINYKVVKMWGNRKRLEIFIHQPICNKLCYKYKVFVLSDQYYLFLLLFQFVMNQGPCVLIQCIVVIVVLLTIFKESAGNIKFIYCS